MSESDGPAWSLTLDRPDWLAEGHWTAITDHVDRISRAHTANDLSLLIGSSKELCETVAKVACAHSGVPVPQSMDELTKNAMNAVSRWPNSGNAAGGDARHVAEHSRKLVAKVIDARNNEGTGHGHAVSPNVDPIDAHLVANAALAWTRWLLGHLGQKLGSIPGELVDDLSGGEIFYRGSLDKRLRSAQMGEWTPDQQRAVCMAVAQRGGAGETFVVWHDGVRMPADSDDVETYPVDYRIGVAWGLFIDADGGVRPARGAATALPGVLAPLNDQGLAVIDELTAAVPERLADDAPRSESLRDVAHDLIVQALDNTSGMSTSLAALSEVLSPAQEPF